MNDDRANSRAIAIVTVGTLAAVAVAMGCHRFLTRQERNTAAQAVALAELPHNDLTDESAMAETDD